MIKPSESPSFEIHSCRLGEHVWSVARLAKLAETLAEAQCRESTARRWRLTGKANTPSELSDE